MHINPGGQLAIEFNGHKIPEVQEQFGWVDCVAKKNYQNANNIAFLTAMSSQIVKCGLSPHQGNYKP